MILTVSSPARGVDGHGEGSDLSQVSHDGVLVVRSESVVAGEPHHWRHPVVVVLAVPGDAAVAAGVGPVVLGDVTEQLEVSVTQLGDGAHTASSTATGESVGGAGGHLLAGQGGQVPGVDGGVGLDHLGGAESPAGTAGSLVLHLAHSSLVSPVHGLGQISGSLHSEALQAAGHDGCLLVASHVVGLELSLRQVAELVDSHRPAGAGLVVLLILLQVLRENVVSPQVLRPGV